MTPTATRDGMPPPPTRQEALGAAAQHLAQVWPGEGKRHKCYLALAGGLLSDGLPQAEVERLVECLTTLTRDEEVAGRLADVRSTALRLQRGGAVTGWSRLAQSLDPRAIGEVRRLLGLVITVEHLARHKRLPAGFLRTQIGLIDLDLGGVGIPYRDAGGKVVEVKQRTRLVAKDGSYWPKGRPLMAYGEDRLGEAPRAGYLAVVEGESDAWVLWFHNLPALGIPGAGTVAKTLHRGHVGGVQTVYVWREPDVGGAEFVEDARRRLGELGWAGTLKEISVEGVKDPSDLHVACEDEGCFRRSWAGALAAARPLAVERPAPTRAPAEVTARRVAYRPLPEFRPFPLGALPPVLSELVPVAARSIGCDPALVAVPALAAAAGCVGNARAVLLKRGWTEPCVVWSVIVAESGGHKSPALDKAVGPLMDLQMEALDEHKLALERHKEELGEWQSQKKEERGEKPEPPEDPARFIASDPTIEALGELLDLLQDKGGAVLLPSLVSVRSPSGGRACG